MSIFLLSMLVGMQYYTCVVEMNIYILCEAIFMRLIYSFNICGFWPVPWSQSIHDFWKFLLGRKRTSAYDIFVFQEANHVYSCNVVCYCFGTWKVYHCADFFFLRPLTQNLTLFLSSLCLCSYDTTIVEGNIVKPSTTKMQFKTERKVGKTGVMLVGIGGNNGW